MTGANGSGANLAPTRSTGASSQSNAFSWTTAAISAPKPIRSIASCAPQQRLVGGPARRDNRHVLTVAVHACLSERDRLELVGNLTLDSVQRAVLEEDDRVVVVDRRPAQARNVLRGRGEDH